MDDGLTFALVHPWWGWKSRPVQRVMLRVCSARFADVVEEQFRANRATGRFPADWEDLTVLGRTPQTIARSRDGKQGPPAGYLAGVASLVGVEPAAFVPVLSEWVAGAAVLLARPRAFDRLAARTYAKAVLGRPPWRGYAVRQEELVRFLAEHDPAVGFVARELGPVLADLHAKMESESDVE